MRILNRWVLLEHSGDPADPVGQHFDLLLEDGMTCRSWRLKVMPVLNGPPVELFPSIRHRLEWLDIEETAVSEERGWAKRIISGCFRCHLPKEGELLDRIHLESPQLEGVLEIDEKYCYLRRGSTC